MHRSTLLLANTTTTSAVYFAHPLLALSLVVAMSIWGVIGRSLKDGKQVCSTHTLGRCMLAVLLGLGVFAWGEAQVDNNLWLIFGAGLGGAFLDTVLPIVNRALESVVKRITGGKP